MQDENAVQRAHHNIIGLVFLARRTEHHAQEIGRVGQVVARIDIRLTLGVLVRHRDQCRHFRDQPQRRDVAVLRVADVERIMVEGRHRAHQPGQHRHRVRVAAETAQEELHLLVHHGVMRHYLDEIRLLRPVRELAVQQQVAGFEEVAMPRDLFDRVAAIHQFALVAVDVGDFRIAGRRRQESRVVGEHAGLAVERANIDDVGADSAAEYGKLDRLASAVGERGFTSRLHHHLLCLSGITASRTGTSSSVSIAERLGEPRIGALGACANQVQQRLASIAQSGLERGQMGLCGWSLRLASSLLRTVSGAPAARAGTARFRGTPGQWRRTDARFPSGPGSAARVPSR